MSNLPALPTDFTALFIVGLSFGFGVCSVSCLPLVGAYIIGNSRKSADGCWALLSFACGRLFTASILGGICAGLGQAVVKSLETPVMTLISGIFTLSAGLFILVRPRCVHCRANNRAHTPPFILGLASPLVPCLPYAAMMASAAASGCVWKGAGMAVVFILGTTLSPLIPACMGMGWIGAGMTRRLPDRIAGFGRAAGVIVIINGINTVWLYMNMT